MPDPSAAYDDALRLAAVVHAGQTWKGTTLPYVTHVVRVSRHLEQAGAAPPLVLAGLLHDTLEDLEDSPALRTALREVDPAFEAPPGGEALRVGVVRLIDARVGVEARVLVEAVTAPSSGGEERPAARRERREAQLEHLRHATDDVVRLKAADTWANVTELAREVAGRGAAAARVKVPVEELRWYYGEVVAIVCARLGRDDFLAATVDKAFEELRA